MHEHKKHKLVPSIYGVIALISTYIHHTATKLHLISTPLIIYMFNFSLWPLGALFFFSLACINVIGFKFQKSKMSFEKFEFVKFGNETRHRGTRSDTRE